MIGLAIVFTLIAATALLVVPRAWAPLPFLLGACYMTMGQKIDLGPASLDMVRILIAAGCIRVVMRQERPAGGINGLDKILTGFALWAVASSPFHTSTSQGNPFVYRLGLAYNVLGIYFMMRCFVHSLDDVVRVAKTIGIVLVPVALEMIHEKFTGLNVFSIFGGVSPNVTVRNGTLRAQGPFMHPILAGTVGSVCFPYLVSLYSKHRSVAVAGASACVAMVLASGSSGPVMSLVFGIFALCLWRWRYFTRQMRFAAVIAYIVLELVMKAPAYYVITRIDITGSSTGWHRGRLIEMSLAHLNEWWIGGTDYTRHWMPTGVSWSPEHTDITNHYLAYGVIGGLPLTSLFIFALTAGFRYVGGSLLAMDVEQRSNQFFVWSLGAALFAQAATCISVAYFDQSYIFLYLNLAVIGSLWQTRTADSTREAEDVMDFQSHAPHDIDSATQPVHF